MPVLSRWLLGAAVFSGERLALALPLVDILKPVALSLDPLLLQSQQVD